MNGKCTRVLVISLSEANSEDVAGMVIGIGSTRHIVGLNNSTCDSRETFEIDPHQRDIRVWEQEKGDGPVQGKGKGKGNQGKGQSKGKHTVSGQETSGNERLDEMLRSWE